jgi:hypothetical protein
MLIHGKCHCGNIAFALDWPGVPSEIVARACGCTFCVKHGGVWTSNPGARLSITLKQADAVSRYSFGTETATFHVCMRCGVVPFVTSEISNRLYAVVNVNTFEDFDATRLRRQGANSDGEARESRLVRRQRNWIADVQVMEEPV